LLIAAQRGYLRDVGGFDPRLVGSLREQLVRRQEILNAGARPIGWKLGIGDRERIGSGPVVGYLTSATLLPHGGSFVGPIGSQLHADAEVALELGADGTITRFGAALELVDLSDSGTAEQIVAANVFHRAAVFGTFAATSPTGSFSRLVVNGETRAHARVPDTDYARALGDVARLLGTVGERLQPGDRLITGSVVQVSVAAGDDVAAELGPLGRAAAHIAREPPSIQ
jgi:2-keto-4-pentenoate hydratase